MIVLKGKSSAMAEALTQAAIAISTQSNAPNPTRASPAKVIESRSKCYEQPSDLSNLKASGVLTAEEYLCEKDRLEGNSYASEVKDSFLIE